MKNKEWYKSKTIQSGLAVFIVTLLMQLGINLPYELIYSACAAFGMIGVRDAIDKIQKK